MQVLRSAASRALGMANLGSPGLLFGKAGWLRISGAILLSCAMCIVIDPLAIRVAFSSLHLHYEAWRFRVLL